MTRILVLTLALVTLAPTVRLAHANDPAERAARRYYERGQKLFNLQRFEDALEQYQKAFDAKPIPDFLFNIGQCQRNLGDYEAAIFSFKRFLKLDPEAPNREKVEALIADLEERIEEGESRKFGFERKKRRGGDDDDDDDDDDSDREREPGTVASPVYKKWWFWTGVAVVGVVGGVGIYAATRPDGPPDTGLGNVVLPAP